MMVEHPKFARQEKYPFPENSTAPRGSPLKYTEHGKKPEQRSTPTGTEAVKLGLRVMVSQS